MAQNHASGVSKLPSTCLTLSFAEPDPRQGNSCATFQREAQRSYFIEPEELGVRHALA